ncbi:MAG: phosphorylase [Rhodospirillales bacterium]|nr:phosphorylase [Rhodospirillales bacterium]
MGRLGIITGLAQEADCLDVLPVDDRPQTRISGARPDRAVEQSQDLIRGGCQALLSFGMAGGLRADLKPGAVMVASSVIAPDGRVFETSTPWLERVMESLGEEATTGAIAGSDTVVGTPAAKRELAEATSAALVDMESHAVAAVAEDAGIPFLVIRAVADPADRVLPGWLIGHITETGRPRYGAILAGLATHPWDLAGLLRLKGDSDRAFQSLRRVAGRLGPLFGLP